MSEYDDYLRYCLQMYCDNIPHCDDCILQGYKWKKTCINLKCLNFDEAETDDLFEAFVIVLRECTTLDIHLMVEEFMERFPEDLGFNDNIQRNMDLIINKIESDLELKYTKHNNVEPSYYNNGEIKVNHKINKLKESDNNAE